MTSNVIVLMTSRSGSSLVTGMFARHGWWTGGTYTNGDYQTYENHDLKKITSCLPVSRGEWCEPDMPLGWEPDESPWVVKVGVEHLPYFAHFDALVVGVYRPLESIVNSVMRRNPSCRKYVEVLTQRRQEMIAERADIIVDTQKLVSGDYSGIRAAIEMAGGVFRPAVANQLIEPERWHH